jgi:primosomal protein N' (replication factor Y)
MSYAEIAVDAPLGPGRTLTYAIPPNASVTPGNIVWVPLGARIVSGVVFKISEETDVDPVRPIIETQTTAFLLSSQQLVLASWLSLETLSSLYEAAALMLPWDFQGREFLSLKFNSLNAQEHHDTLSQIEKDVIDVLKQGRQLRRSYINDSTRRAIRSLLQKEIIVRKWFPRSGARVQYREFGRLAISSGEAISLIGKGGKRLTALIEFLSTLPENENDAELTLLRKWFGPGVVRRAIDKGVLEVHTRRNLRDPMRRYSVSPQPNLQLTSSQASSLAAITSSLRDQAGQTFLLRGVTGSGKTEVYMQALKQCVDLKMRGIYLVPEIALTAQLTERLTNRFPGKVGLLHSGLTVGERYDTWWRIREGDYEVVLGSRSAIFAPQPNLGLIILDEEHEWTYKQQDVPPLYHARSVAEKWAELIGATVVLGSATPDVTIHHQAQQGKYHLLSMTERLSSTHHQKPIPVPLPSVEVVDMREELKAGVRSIFSRRLQEALTETLSRGDQAMLFLNRRGSSSIIQCRECGYAARCSACDRPMTYHAARNRLFCHHCGRRQSNMNQCPICSGQRIRYLGVGTQTVSQELERLFGIHPIRWDRDTAPNRIAHDKILSHFARGDNQVLVGTQMIAKGLDLPHVKLVGAILADLSLHIPDYRSGERTFQLLCQVTGRAGRDGSPSLAIIQTYSPTNYAILAAAKQDYLAYAKSEIEFRQQYRYPPFYRLARLLFEHTDPTYAETQTRQIASYIRSTIAKQRLPGIDLIGPAPAYPMRSKGRYRWHVIVRAAEVIANELPGLLKPMATIPGWKVEIDPVSLV